MIFTFWYFLRCFSKTNYIKKRRFKATSQRWKSTTCLNGWFASKPLFCCHLCSVLQICSTLKGLARIKHLPCATCFLKHIISKMAISSQGGFVPLNKTLTGARRAEVCSDFTVCSCVQRWVTNATHKIKCHNIFREQGVCHRYWSTGRRFCLALHLHFQAGWHLWLPVFTNKKSNSDLPESTALSFSCLATIRALFRMAWVQNTFFFLRYIYEKSWTDNI